MPRKKTAKQQRNRRAAKEQIRNLEQDRVYDRKNVRMPGLEKADPFSGLISLKGDLFRTANMDEKRSLKFAMALRLRFAVGDSIFCPRIECKRNQICAFPVLDCHHRQRADDYNWDWGWFYSQRKHLYGLAPDDDTPGYWGGSPEYVAEQIQQWRDSYAEFGNTDAARRMRRAERKRLAKLGTVTNPKWIDYMKELDAKDARDSEDAKEE
jgi:hypothetical protein